MDVKGAEGVAVDGLGDVLEVLHAAHEVIVRAQGAAQHRLVQRRGGMVVALHVDHDFGGAGWRRSCSPH